MLSVVVAAAAASLWYMTFAGANTLVIDRECLAGSMI
jgi:hypothetical protein